MVEEIILREIRGLRESLAKALGKLRHHYPKHKELRREIVGVLYISIDQNNFIIMANLNLKPGKRYTVTPGIIDSVNLAPVPGAQLVAVKSNTIDNPAVAIIDADGKAAYVGPGKANLTNVATWTYNDENTGDSVTADVTTTVSINALQPAEVVTGTVSLDNEEDIPAAAQAQA